MPAVLLPSSPRPSPSQALADLASTKRGSLASRGPPRWHYMHAFTVFSTQAQGRIPGAEARRASIDGQIIRQAPVGREERQCRSHSGPLCWRPPPGLGSSSWFARGPKPTRPPNRTHPPAIQYIGHFGYHHITTSIGAENRPGIRSEASVGTVIIGKRAALGKRERRTSQRVIWEKEPLRCRDPQ